MNQPVLNFEDALQADPSPLVSMQLLKAVGGEGDEGPWVFEGIASDESVDVDGDSILRKALDVSYAAQRGYVNWDHGRGPGDQIGFLTACEVLSKSRAAQLRDTFPKIGDSPTVYVRGELYKHVPRAEETLRLLKSVPEGGHGPGISLDGAVARDAKTRGVVRAFVRGVAITPVPAQPYTTARLKKSLEAYNVLAGVDGQPSDLGKEIAEMVLLGLEKSVNSRAGFSREEAVMWVLKKKPHWTYDLANKFVSYTFRNIGRGA